jgi:hypothetical protein
MLEINKETNDLKPKLNAICEDMSKELFNN